MLVLGEILEHCLTWTCKDASDRLSNNLSTLEVGSRLLTIGQTTDVLSGKALSRSRSER